MNLTQAIFIKSAQTIHDSPALSRAEVVFMGRSNVGKSSLLNSLTSRKNLAKSSQTPGKTKLINFFDINYQNKAKENFSCSFVDLPGFGYAKVSKAQKENWSENLTEFLKYRQSIRVFIRLIDSRHENIAIDLEVEQFLHDIKKPDQIIISCYTKIDKLKKSDLAKLKQKHTDAVFVSNLKNTGQESLNDKITNFLFSGGDF